MKKYFVHMVSLFSVIILLGQGCVSFGGGTETTGPAGMFISTDVGEVWQQISFVPEIAGTKDISLSSVYRMYVDPQDEKTMYWATRGEGMYYTYDNGKTWSQPPGELARGFIYGIAIHPKDTCTIYATNGLQIFSSTDCSRSYTELYRDASGGGIVSLAVNPYLPHQVYAIKNDGTLMVSFDSGISWKVTHRFAGSPVDIFADLSQNGRMYVATRQNGLYRSNNAGETWESLSGAMSAYSDANEYRRLVMYQDRPGVLFYVSTYGVLKSEDGGSNWYPLNLINPPGSVRIFAFAVNPHNENELYYTATIDSFSTFYKSIDGGESWITKKLPSGQIPTYLRVHADNPEWLYIGFTIPPKQ